MTFYLFLFQTNSHVIGVYLLEMVKNLVIFSSKHIFCAIINGSRAPDGPQGHQGLHEPKPPTVGTPTKTEHITC